MIDRPALRRSEPEPSGRLSDGQEAQVDAFLADRHQRAWVEGCRQRIAESAADLPPLAADVQRAYGVALTVDSYVRQATEHYDRLGGPAKACAPGCHWCCVHRIVCTWGEALRIADAITDHPEMVYRVTVDAKLNAGLSQMGHVRRRSFCPFLVERQCSIYAARPSCCRTYVSCDAGKCKAAYRSMARSEAVPQPGWSAEATAAAALLELGEERGELAAMVVRALPLVPLLRALVKDLELAAPDDQAMPSAAL